MKTRPKRAPGAKGAAWRRRSFEVLTSAVVAGHAAGPPPPGEWAGHLRQLVAASRAPVEGPPWWTADDAYFGNVETRTDPRSYRWDGMRRLGPRDRPLVFFQLTLAGWGCFELYGKPPRPVPPGAGFFAVVPSRHRYYLPPDSPGWTFAWIGIYHPYLLQRIARRVAAGGPLVTMSAGSPLAASTVRLVRGAFEKDFRDRFEVELALFTFLHAYERYADELRDPEGDRERLLEWLRARVLADPRHACTVDVVAAERGMTRSHFSHHFHARTGLTPARFMNETRVQEAARALLASRASLKHVATEWGFANASHFGRVFRRFHHVSPAAYRRSFAV
ncbi:MAG TPA: AraC family transcriptional regulator [Polyangia bacterium]|nr:AraC family transcriptional regulator [Polyangia bacterium]